nr:hypothetical protein BaRGS_017562 [Batillaria attramentaria]
MGKKNKKQLADKTQSQRKGRLEEEGEEEQLTHYGQSLADIEKFEDPQDSDPDEDGNISGKMVAQEHFGGFLTRRTEEPGSEKKSWKEKMADLISQSKKEKTEKDDIAKKTQELDEEWKSVHQLLFAKKKSDQPDSKDLRKADDYDISVRKLQFEIKGKPSNRLKSEEEIAKEEAERLKKLEADRKRRMMGESEPSEKGPTHISADSLEDSFDPTDSRKKKFHVMFKDGHLLEKPQKQGKKKAAADEESDKSDESDNDDDGEENGDDADDKGDESGEEGSEEESDDDDDDDHDDLKSSEDEDEEEAQKIMDALLKKKMGPAKSILKKSKTDVPVNPEEQEKIADAAKKELPYTFDGSNAVLQFLLDRYDEFQQICQRRGGRGKYMGLDTISAIQW